MTQTLTRMARGTLAVAAVAASAVVAPSVAQGAKAPRAETTPAVDVTDTSATLTGRIDTRGDRTAYRFAYESDASTRLTAVATLEGSREVASVAVPVTGLTPDTDHRFRVLAWRLDDDEEDRDDDAERIAIGALQLFRTIPGVLGASSSAPGASLAPPAPVASPAPATAATGQQGAAAAPELARSVVVAPVSGTVTVQVPGAPGFSRLAAASAVPVGAVVDARAGKVRLTAALPGGATQAGEFHGGRFEVRQTRSARGATELRLRGGNFGLCPRRGATARAAQQSRRRKPPVRRLWSRDNGGRFLTRGRNSVATVRGTRWVTTDTCAGTRTTVTSGAVSVRDLRRKRTVLVRAGQSYLARSPR